VWPTSVALVAWLRPRTSPRRRRRAWRALTRSHAAAASYWWMSAPSSSRRWMTVVDPAASPLVEGIVPVSGACRFERAVRPLLVVVADIDAEYTVELAAADDEQTRFANQRRPPAPSDVDPVLTPCGVEQRGVLRFRLFLPAPTGSLARAASRRGRSSLRSRGRRRVLGAAERAAYPNSTWRPHMD
jgi:hypothetical protein